ncbi:amino acid/polyamine/organocation transporter (APC superfamily) [Algoriphagus aquaeductus]|uniref:Amino acid/polyamine/organocation transporter (APC superfamily) n=1 Tax=Algoriphagus aquaeductus TaxID=475299 RepID=A0A326RRZ6_9BACT|nr:amino acid permease [Algoriphagus aquaeductus]PZV83798.1 amino acid/polyamine/organocation transporter (APC superfamily) [Algoriphagus aquaeductus]
MLSNSKISWKTAAGLVVANMIGTGVFTSLGFQLAVVQNTWTILILWMVGGIMALIGSFVYAELGTHFRRTGGDYIFLSESIHPSVGYLYAWVSLVVGFSAPIAIAAMAMNNYLSPLFGQSILPGLFFLLAVPIAHIFSVSRSAQFQDLMTLVKILFVLVLIGMGLFSGSKVEVSAIDLSSSWQEEVLLPGFAVSLIYVFYAYTGWNSAAYIIEEVDQPQKNLPKALISATLSVMVIYILLQLVLLKHASVDQLSGKVEVADIAFGNLLGSGGALWVSFFIGIQLIATISGYAWVGPRVTYAMAKDFKLWHPLAKINSNGIPVRAIFLNSAISLILFVSGSFEQVMLYAGFVLQLMGTVTIFSSLRIQKENGFKTPFKPLLQIIYLIFSSAIMGYLVWDRPKESLAGIGILLLGAMLYAFDSRASKS